MRQIYNKCTCCWCCHRWNIGINLYLIELAYVDYIIQNGLKNRQYRKNKRFDNIDYSYEIFIHIFAMTLTRFDTCFYRRFTFRFWNIFHLSSHVNLSVAFVYVYNTVYMAIRWNILTFFKFQRYYLNQPLYFEINTNFITATTHSCREYSVLSGVHVRK